MKNSQKVPKSNKKAAKLPRVQRVTHDKSEKDKAAKYYIMGLTLPEISKLLDNTPVRTLEKWQLAGKWTSLRNCSSLFQQVLQLHEAGKSRKEISLLVNRDESTVYRWIKKARLESNITDI